MMRRREDVAERVGDPQAPSSVRFSGGPLDGRVTTLPPGHAVDGNVVTHVHLHEGPKIETRYRLGVGRDGGWEYRLLDR